MHGMQYILTNGDIFFQSVYLVLFFGQVLDTKILVEEGSRIVLILSLLVVVWSTLYETKTTNK